MVETTDDFKRTMPGYTRDPGQFGGVLTDPLEANVNIGAPNAWYRTGRVVYVDGFEGGLQPWRVGSSGDGFVLQSITRSFFGNACAEINPNTNGTAVTDTFLEKFFPFILSGLHGFECAIEWLWDGVTAVADFSIFVLVQHKTGDSFVFRITIDANDRDLRVRDSSGTMQTFEADTGPLLFTGGSRYFHVMKLVIDAETGAYKYFRFNKSIYDLSAYSAQNSGGSSQNQIVIDLLTDNSNGLARQLVYLDNVIYTLNELDAPF